MREAPPHIVARLREVDPTVDLIYLGLGVWVLGSVQPNSFRREAGQRLLESERARPQDRQSMGRYRMARLIFEGVRTIDLVDEKDVHSGKVVRDFRFADWRYRHCADAAFEENLRGSDDETDFERRKALLLDWSESELPGIWNHAFRGRRNFTQRGLPWLN